ILIVWVVTHPAASLMDRAYQNMTAAWTAGTSGERAPKRRGRRVAGEDTRAALLAAAREVFTERGVTAATVRMIAARGGGDPARVNHWFGGKQGLFAAAIERPAEPAPRPLDNGDPNSLGEQIVRTFVDRCDSTGGGEFAALVRSL